MLYEDAFDGMHDDMFGVFSGWLSRKETPPTLPSIAERLDRQLDALIGADIFAVARAQIRALPVTHDVCPLEWDDEDGEF